MSEFEAQVDDLSHDGRGVTRVDGKVYFVEGALPGELIRFQRTKRHRRHETGKLVEILEPSDDRVEPPCQYFGVCGGCAMQHLDSAAQVAYKQGVLLDSLRRIGKVDPTRVLEPLTGASIGYRRKARLGIRFVPKKGGVLVGFRERHKSYITSLDECLALDPNISCLLPALHQLVGALSCYDRVPQIEVARGDSQVALVFRHLEALTDQDHERLQTFACDHDVDIYLQSGGPDTVMPLRTGEARLLQYRLDEFDINIRFDPTDFVQVNADVNDAMVKRAVELLQPNVTDNILELFCGIGNFSLPFARRAGSVVAVEANEIQVERARGNAQLNNIDNTEFVVADLYSDQIESLKRFDHCNKLFLDPPRSGAIETVKELVPKLKPERIVYVSCNPATLARDSELLVNKENYRLDEVGIIDMFPHTTHVESIAVFNLK
ncbi:MAG: 23S rRNA (uracil(1939)-C(5))-methyltransferase RlmD [marine bacterium B5-7]|nr:MAG: 23S rRNA (uracil(1939)-C(5))-methyltransferase RlmD [marine bacterium B5-7]